MSATTKRHFQWTFSLDEGPGMELQAMVGLVQDLFQEGRMEPKIAIVACNW